MIRIHSLVYKLQCLKATNLRIFVKMEKSEFRLLIKHYFLRGKTLSETKGELDKYHSNSAPSYGMVQKWFTEFRCGRTRIEIIQSLARVEKLHGAGQR